MVELEEQRRLQNEDHQKELSQQEKDAAQREVELQRAISAGEARIQDLQQSAENNERDLAAKAVEIRKLEAALE